MLYKIIFAALFITAIVLTLYFGLRTEDSTDPLVWVAVGEQDGGGTQNPGNIMYSTDGKKWEEIKEGPSFLNGNGVAYSSEQDRWVAVGDADNDSDSIMWSDNGKNWVPSSQEGASFASGGNNVAYGKDLWVAVGDNNTGSGGTCYRNILSSPDGKVWTQSSDSGDFFRTDGRDVAYGKDENDNDLWVAVGNNEDLGSGDPGGFGNIMYSTTGTCWVKSSSSGASFAGFAGLGNGVAYGKDLWVAVGNNEDPYGNIMYSSGGINWKKTTEGASFAGQGVGVAYSSKQDRWVAVGSDSDSNGNIMWSDTGTCWVQSTISGASFAQTGLGVAYSSKQDRWVAVGMNDGGTCYGNILFSPDGKVWTQSSDSGDFFRISGQSVASNG